MNQLQKPKRSDKEALMECVESISNLDWSFANLDWSANVFTVQKEANKIRKMLDEPAVSPAERGYILNLLPKIEECASHLLFAKGTVKLHLS